MGVQRVLAANCGIERKEDKTSTPLRTQVLAANCGIERVVALAQLNRASEVLAANCGIESIASGLKAFLRASF